LELTSIIRQVDDLGRIVVPKEIREQWEIKPGESVEVFFEPEEESIILKKYQRGCFFCDTVEVEKLYKGKGICKECLMEMKAKVKDDVVQTNNLSQTK